jgi:hypothetical protein
MLAAGNTKITDLLSVTPNRIPEGAHAMTQLVELPPADAGLAPHRHSGPVFGYVLEGRVLFEIEGEAPAKSVRVRRFGNLAGKWCTTKSPTSKRKAGAGFSRCVSAPPAWT